MLDGIKQMYSPHPTKEHRHSWKNLFSPLHPRRLSPPDTQNTRRRLDPRIRCTAWWWAPKPWGKKREMFIKNTIYIISFFAHFHLSPNILCSMCRRRNKHFYVSQYLLNGHLRSILRRGRWALYATDLYPNTLKGKLWVQTHKPPNQSRLIHLKLHRMDLTCLRSLKQELSAQMMLMWIYEAIFGAIFSKLIMTHQPWDEFTDFYWTVKKKQIWRETTSTCRWIKTTDPRSLHVPPCRSTWSIRKICRKRIPLQPITREL